jgi:hypothetical protein
MCVQCFQRTTGSWLEDPGILALSGIFRDVTDLVNQGPRARNLCSSPLSEDFSSASWRWRPLRLPAEGARLSLILADTSGKTVSDP